MSHATDWITDEPLTPYDHPRRQLGRVLVVDDDAGIRMIVTRQLQLAGFSAVAAETGPEALEMLRRDASIRLVLLDLVMPGVDGWTVRKEMLQDPLLAHVPVVVMTGAPLPALVHDDLQAADYLLKPIGREHLVSVANNYCKPVKRAA